MVVNVDLGHAQPGVPALATISAGIIALADRTLGTDGLPGHSHPAMSAANREPDREPLVPIVPWPIGAVTPN